MRKAIMRLLMSANATVLGPATAEQCRASDQAPYGLIRIDYYGNVIHQQDQTDEDRRRAPVLVEPDEAPDEALWRIMRQAPPSTAATVALELVMRHVAGPFDREGFAECERMILDLIGDAQ